MKLMEKLFGINILKMFASLFKSENCDFWPYEYKFLVHKYSQDMKWFIIVVFYGPQAFLE